MREDVTEWDIDRFSEPLRNVADKTKYFPYPQWGHLSDPATVLDVHGRVLVWYLPGIMPPARVEHLNKIHLPLKDSLVKCSKTGGQSKRRFGHRHVPEADGNEMFGHGRLMNSPATFQQAHMRLEDSIYQSSSLRKGVVRQWLQDISYAEEFWNKIGEIVLPDLAQVGRDAISVKGDWVVSQPPSPIGWPSIYLGIDVIVNQETPPHLDQVSAPSLLDLVEHLANKTPFIGMWKGKRGSPSPLGNMDLGCQVFGPGNSFGWGEFLEGPWAIAKCKVHFLLIWLGGGAGTWSAVEGDVMDIVGLIVSRLEQSSAGTKEPKEGGEGAEMGGCDREDEEKEEEEAPAVIPTQKRKRAESGIVTRGKKVAKQAL
ncbi:hypothetical protein BKA83DRAFT_4493390 [Pisolithus microcarpus]|nr:hypothetical protein BKA83DRAFT_4493390 [Pisolithus microcarpus]